MAKNDLKKILQKEGILQAELARKSGVSAGTINRLCSKKRAVTPTTQAKIIKALNQLTDKKYGVYDIFPEG